MQTYPCYECGKKDKRIAELEALVRGISVHAKARTSLSWRMQRINRLLDKWKS